MIGALLRRGVQDEQRECPAKIGGDTIYKPRTEAPEETILWTP